MKKLGIVLTVILTFCGCNRDDLADAFVNGADRETLKLRDIKAPDSIVGKSYIGVETGGATTTLAFDSATSVTFTDTDSTVYTASYTWTRTGRRNGTLVLTFINASNETIVVSSKLTYTDIGTGTYVQTSDTTSYNEKEGTFTL